MSGLFDQAEMDRQWDAAMADLRARGENPEEMLQRASLVMEAADRGEFVGRDSDPVDDVEP